MHFHFFNTVFPLETSPPYNGSLSATAFHFPPLQFARIFTSKERQLLITTNGSRKYVPVRQITSLKRHR